MPEPIKDPNPNPDPDPNPTPDPKSEPKKEDSYSIKIDGEDKVLSLEELKNLASKSGGADARFQEAATMKKEAERGIRINTLIQSLENNDEIDENEAKELAGLLGIDQNKFLVSLQEEEEPPQKAKKGQSQTGDWDSEFQRRFGVTPAEVKAQLEHSQNRHIADARREIKEFSDKAVDKDEIIGKMIVGEDRQEVLDAVKNMVFDDVLRKIGDGGTYGTELVASSVQRVRSQLTKLGIPKKSNQQPIVLGLGTGVELPSEIQADEPIKRISSVEDKDEQNVIARTMQRIIKAARQKR